MDLSHFNPLCLQCAAKATSICERTVKVLAFEPLSHAERRVKRVVQLPLDRELSLRQIGPNPSDQNSAILVMFQVLQRGNFKMDVALAILAEIMEKPAYHELRTKQQLGYMVWCGTDILENVHSIYFIIQSTVADPIELDRRIEAFLVQFKEETLGPLTDEEFDNYVSSMISVKSETDKRQATRSNRFWAEIGCQEFVYDRRQQHVAALSNLKKRDVVALFDAHIAKSGSERRKCSSHLFGVAHPMTELRQDEALADSKLVFVSNPVAYRDSGSLYPVGPVSMDQE
jgi:insulysin